MKKIIAAIAFAAVSVAASAQTAAPAATNQAGAAVQKKDAKATKWCNLHDKCDVLIDDTNFNDGIYRAAGQ